MSRIGITYEEVASAAKKLQNSGENPTVDRIRNLLGTGSNSTIARYLRDWKKDLDEAIENNKLPPDLLTIINDLWEKVQGKANQRILTLEQETEQKINAKEQKYIELHKKTNEQTTQIHKLEEGLNNQILANTAIKKELGVKDLELSKLHAYCDLINNQIAEQRSENDKLHQLLNNMQQNLEHYQSSIQKLQQEQSLLMEKHKLKYELEINQIQEKYFMETDEKNKFKLLFEQTSNSLEKYETKYNSIEKILKEQEITTATLQNKYDSLVEQHQQTCIKLKDQSNLLTTLEQKLQLETIALQKTNQELQSAEDKIKKLRHEKLFLVEEKANLQGQIKAFTQHTKLCSNA